MKIFEFPCIYCKRNFKTVSKTINKINVVHCPDCVSILREFKKKYNGQKGWSKSPHYQRYCAYREKIKRKLFEQFPLKNCGREPKSPIVPPYNLKEGKLFNQDGFSLGEVVGINHPENLIYVRKGLLDSCVGYDLRLVKQE